MAFALRTKFDSLADFEAALPLHEKAVSANFVKQTRVKLQMNRKKKITFGDVEKFKVHALYLRCKKGGVPQVKNSVQNIRQTASYRNNCPAQFKIAFDHVDKKLVVVSLNDQHNHACTAKIFESMPKQRRLKGDEAKFVEDALKVKANARLLQLEVKKNFEVSLSLKDIHNVKSKLKASELNSHNRSPLESIYDELQKGDGMIAEIITSAENNELQGIYVQDARMRKYFQLYPELLIVDATYKVNDRRMPLFVVLVVDGNGESQIAALFIIKSENDAIITQMFTKFKASNENHGQIKVILSDKNFADRRAYSECFPQAKLQLCIFHVMQAWRRELKITKMRITAAQKQESLKIMERMVYAPTRIEEILRSKLARRRDS